MLGCCNSLFRESFSYVLLSTKYFYRKIEFGICPHCGCLKFKDFQIFADGTEKVAYSKGKHASQKMEYWRKRLNNTKYGTKSNQNVYYGDFKKTSKTDENNLPVYQQLRKNFNGQSEVLGEIKTKVIPLF